MKYILCLLVKELERGAHGMDGIPGRGLAVLVVGAFVGEERVVRDVLAASAGRVMDSVAHMSVNLEA